MPPQAEDGDVFANVHSSGYRLLLDGPLTLRVIHNKNIYLILPYESAYGVPGVPAARRGAVALLGEVAGGCGQGAGAVCAIRPRARRRIVVPIAVPPGLLAVKKNAR